MMIIEGEKCDEWKVLDFGNIILHLFDAPTREKYDLESLWTVGRLPYRGRFGGALRLWCFCLNPLGVFKPGNLTSASFELGPAWDLFDPEIRQLLTNTFFCAGVEFDELTEGLANENASQDVLSQHMAFVRSLTPASESVS